MKYLFFESTTTLTFDAPVVDHHFLLRCLPPSFPGQRILSSVLQITPSVPYTLSYDGFGNMTETGCIKFPHTEFVYATSGRVEICEEERMTEKLHPLFRFPSRYTAMTEEMKDFAHNLLLKGSALEKSEVLAQAIYEHMTYTPGVTNTHTLAQQAFSTGQGVCQDYSHIFIAMSRYLGIPARYANGAPLGEGPSHAWTEVYVDGKWVGIDPTHNRLVGEDYVRFCVGRDFADCALERGILVGKANQTQITTGKVVEQI